MAEQATPDRSGFGSRLGFVLAAIGSAVGFGSIARFPMNTANNGGAAFVLLYIVMMVALGIPLMIAEFSLGRTAQKNVAGAFGRLQDNIRTKWRWLGVFFLLVSAFFLSWYSIVSGWTLRYFFETLAGTYFDAEKPADHIAGVGEGPWTLVWHLVIMILVLIVVSGRVSQGIERLNLFLMPLLFAIVVGLAVYAITLNGGGPGYEFYLKPDFGSINLGSVTDAVGQALFSLSLGIGAMMTYSSYLSKGTSLAKNAALVSFSTLGFAVIAGLMVFPMLASFNLLSGEVEGLDLIFKPLPIAFAQMGSPVGQIVGSLFFLAATFAAFSSAIALTEPGISYVVEEWGVSRKRAALLMCSLIYVAGIVVAFSMSALEFEGGNFTNLLVMIGGLLIAIYVGWFTKKAVARARMDESEEGFKFSWFVYPVVRYVIPIVFVVLLFFNFVGTPCDLGGDPKGRGLLGQIFGTGDFLQCTAGPDPAPAGQFAPP